MAKPFFFGEGPFYPMLVRSEREGSRHVLTVASVGARGGGGTCKATADYTYTIDSVFFTQFHGTVSKESSRLKK